MITEQLIAKTIICIVLASALMSLEPLKAQSGSQSTQSESSAVDVKGVTHRKRDYGEGRSPWDADIIKFVKPDYPSEFRTQHIEGAGLFRITLDVKTGSVTNVAVLRSTSSSGLDASAVRAIRQWRWRPERWREIDVPVTFTLRSHAASSGSTNELARRATTQYKKGDVDRALTTLNELTRQQPTSADVLITRGSAYQLKGQGDEALKDFNKAIRLNPRSARAYCDRAMLEDQLLARPSDALKDYNEAIRLAPDFQRAYFNRGVHFLAEHNHQRAIADFGRAIQLMPNDGSAYAQRAYAYAKQGDRPRALADATAAIKLRPTDIPLGQVTDLDLRAQAHRIIGQRELALRDLREAVRLIPSDASTNADLGWFLATCPEDRFRKGAEAVSAATKACKLSRWHRSDCIDTLAAAYAEAGDFDQAIKYEKQSLSDSSLAPKERREREKRLALFEQRKPFRDEF